MKIHKDLKPEDWIEIRYKGKTYLVSVRALLDLYNVNKSL